MADGLYDVAIIGGGPAGSTAATFLARAGRRVLVIEREKFPRFHIGESLLPFSMDAFRRLGVQEKLLAAGFMEKFGGEMFGACSDEGVKFYFEDGFDARTDRSFQVPRAEFDKLLLDHARENGAEVREETAVETVSFSPDDATLRICGKDSAPEEVGARYVIDASGRNSILGNHFKLKKNYTHLQKISIYAHYEGGPRDPGRDGTLTRMVRAIDRWFWHIPLTDSRTSIGVVLDAATYKRSKLSPEEFLEQAIAGQPNLVRRLEGAHRASPVSVAADFSYRNTKLTGDRWMLAGDAAGFIDPVFSSGVFLAVLAGEEAAGILDVVLDQPRKAPRLFARYERTLHRAMDVYLRFVDAWYSKEFIEVFLHPQDILQIPPAVNAVLGGNVGTSFAIKWRMEIFYLLVRIQKYFPLCPRRTLVPSPEVKAVPIRALETVS
ncbi:MAG: FAD-dependent oxidoreductase [Verrucomicrobiota bacterium]|nr:FAD-dependent oxidoreductase [Verrucomicrobiota bacterium]